MSWVIGSQVEGGYSGAIYDGYTIISQATPSSDQGIVNRVYLYVGGSNYTKVKIGIFTRVGGSQFICTGYVDIGTVLAGYTWRNYAAAVPVIAGQYIGLYYETGSLSYTKPSSYGQWNKSGDQMEAGTQTFSSLIGNWEIPVYGVAISSGHPYISRIQGVAGMRSFSMGGHGAM